MLWVEILNRSLEWETPDFLAGWLREAGLAGPIGSRDQEALWQDLSVLRATFAAPYLGRPFGEDELQCVSQWLESVTLQRPERVTVGGFRLPEVSARRRSSLLPAPLDTLLSTALVQILAAPGAATAGARVERCQGLCRNGPPAHGFAPDDEVRFMARAGFPAALPGGDLSLCPHLVESERRGRFCSKACSNASFAARKARLDPRYFAAKQERYRRRREAPPEPTRRPGAFVYID